MNLPPRIWQADEPVRRSAAQDWVAGRLAWERKVFGPEPTAPTALHDAAATSAVPAAQPARAA